MPDNEPVLQTEPVVEPTTEPTLPLTEPVVSDWKQYLETVDPKELRRHPRIAGIIGSELQRIGNERDRQAHNAYQEAVRDHTEAELLKFSDDNADYLKEHYPKAYDHLIDLQRKRAERETKGLWERARHDLATKVGASFKQIPEWSELTDTDHEQLAKSVAGKTDDDLIATFNQQALHIVAERRAQKRLAEWKDKETTNLREAIRQEEAAKLLQKSQSPDLTEPKSLPSGLDVRKMSDEEFEKYWQKNFKK